MVKYKATPLRRRRDTNSGRHTRMNNHALGTEPLTEELEPVSDERNQFSGEIVPLLEEANPFSRKPLSSPEELVLLSGEMISSKEANPFSGKPPPSPEELVLLSLSGEMNSSKEADPFSGKPLPSPEEMVALSEEMSSLSEKASPFSGDPLSSSEEVNPFLRMLIPLSQEPNPFSEQLESFSEDPDMPMQNDDSNPGNSDLQALDPLSIPEITKTVCDEDGKPKLYSCKICDFAAHRLPVLCGHMLCHSSLRKRKTKGKIIRRFSTKTPTPDKLHTCQLCPFKTPYYQNLKRHTATHVEGIQEVERCRLCDYACFSKSFMMVHNRYEHGLVCSKISDFEPTTVRPETSKKDKTTCNVNGPLLPRRKKKRIYEADPTRITRLRLAPVKPEEFLKEDLAPKTGIVVKTQDTSSINSSDPPDGVKSEFNDDECLSEEEAELFIFQCPYCSRFYLTRESACSHLELHPQDNPAYTERNSIDESVSETPESVEVTNFPIYSQNSKTKCEIELSSDKDHCLEDNTPINEEGGQLVIRQTQINLQSNYENLMEVDASEDQCTTLEMNDATSISGCPGMQRNKTGEIVENESEHIGNSAVNQMEKVPCEEFRVVEEGKPAQKHEIKKIQKGSQGEDGKGENVEQNVQRDLSDQQQIRQLHEAETQALEMKEEMQLEETVPEEPDEKLIAEELREINEITTKGDDVQTMVENATMRKQTQHNQESLLLQDTETNQSNAKQTDVTQEKHRKKALEKELSETLREKLLRETSSNTEVEAMEKHEDDKSIEVAVEEILNMLINKLSAKAELTMQNKCIREDVKVQESLKYNSEKHPTEEIPSDLKKARNTDRSYNKASPRLFDDTITLKVCFCSKVFTSADAYIFHKKESGKQCKTNFLNYIPPIDMPKKKIIKNALEKNSAITEHRRGVPNFVSKTFGRGKGQFKCPICSKILLHRHSFQIHQLLHGDRPFKCDLCSHSYSRRSHLNVHLLSHKNGQVYYCPICPFKAASEVSIRRHQNISHAGVTTTVSNKQFLQKHKVKEILSKNRKQTVKPPSPPKDPKLFRKITNFPIFDTKLGKMLNNFKCPFCDYCSRKLRLVTNHLERSRAGGKMHQCLFKGCEYKACTYMLMRLHHDSVHKTYDARKILVVKQHSEEEEEIPHEKNVPSLGPSRVKKVKKTTSLPLLAFTKLKPFSKVSASKSSSADLTSSSCTPRLESSSSLPLKTHWKIPRKMPPPSDVAHGRQQAETHQQKKTKMNKHAAAAILLPRLGQKPAYKCPLCDYTCTSRNNLVPHTRGRAADAPLHCEACNYKSCTRLLMIYHKARKHRT